MGLLDFIAHAANQNFDTALSQMLSQGNRILDVCLLIAGGGALVQMGKNYLNGGDIWGYVQWVPLLIFLLGYGQFVEGLYKGSSSIPFELGISLEDFTKEPPKEISLNPIEIMSDQIALEMKKMFFIFSVTLLNGIAIAAFLYVKMKVVFKVALLVFIAPINISLSFIPALSYLWQGALVKAIEVAMYIPGLMLIDWIGKTVFLESIKQKVVKNPADAIQMFQNMELGMIFYIMIALSYFSVPKLIGWVMDSGGGASNAASGKLKQAAMTLSKVVTKV